MTRTINLSLSKLSNHYQRKSSFLIFLLILMGVALPSLSGSASYNFFEKLARILMNPYFNMLFFIASGVNVIYMRSEFTKSYNLASRVGDYKTLVVTFIKDIVLATAFLYVIAIILACAGAIIFSFGEHAMVTHPVYGFNVIYYLLFFIVRGFIFTSLVNVIIYLVSIAFRNRLTMLIILVCNVYFLIVSSGKSIKHFYQMSLLYHNYFLTGYYASFPLEIICSLFEGVLLLFICTIICRLIISKKRDLV